MSYNKGVARNFVLVVRSTVDSMLYNDIVNQASSGKTRWLMVDGLQRSLSSFYTCIFYSYACLFTNLWHNKSISPWLLIFEYNVTSKMYGKLSQEIAQTKLDGASNLNSTMQQICRFFIFNKKGDWSNISNIDWAMNEQCKSMSPIFSRLVLQ